MAGRLYSVADRWNRIIGAGIRDLLGTNVEAVNPATGRRCRIE